MVIRLVGDILSESRAWAPHTRGCYEPGTTKPNGPTSAGSGPQVQIVTQSQEKIGSKYTFRSESLYHQAHANSCPPLVAGSFP